MIHAVDSSVTMDITLEGNEPSIFFTSADVPLFLNPESIISATLLPFMKVGAPLSTPAEADPKFLSTLGKIQDIFTTWDPSFSRVSVPSTPVKNEIMTERGVGAFFTGGVDSFYTFLKHQDEITHLIYVHGFENHKITSEIRNIANIFNKEVIEIETNLRAFSNPIVSWYFYHGSALVTIGHLLKQTVGKIYIPSSDTYLNLKPWGSHPLVDPLWSDSSVSFFHDGCEASRLDKVNLIATFDDALNSLRVCWKDTEGVQNCGKCEKCIRTMISLKIIGSLEKCSTFPSEIPLDKLTRISASAKNLESEYEELFHALKKQNADRTYISAVWWVLHKPRIAHRVRELFSGLTSD